MPSAIPHEPVQQKRRVRWNLKWFLVVAALVPALGGLYVKRVLDRRNALSELNAIAPNSSHTHVEYDFQFDDDGMPVPNATSWVPSVLLHVFGHSYFHDIVGVTLDAEHVPIADLQSLRSLPQLKRLDVEYDAVSPAFMETIGTLTGLERLDLQRTGIRDDDLAHLAPLMKMNILLLSSPGITDTGLAHLRKMRDLQHVVLHECSVDGSGLVQLAGLRSLRSLDLRESPIVDAAIDTICGFTELQKLNLWRTRVTDAGARKLVALRKLELLRVPATVTDETLAYLREQLPNCEVQTDQRPRRPASPSLRP